MNIKTLVSAFCAASLTLAFSSTAFAQDTAMKTMSMGQTAVESTVKTLAENEKVLVRDSVYRPGEISSSQSRDGLVVYHLSDFKLERTYADGSKKVFNYKAGDAEIINEKRPYSVKNIGKNTAHLISVRLK